MAGFAEADPTMDVNGMDAAYKLVILAAVAYKANITVDDFPCEGIESIDLIDVKNAEDLGFTIKLLASATQNDDGHCSFMVCPTLISQAHPLASVRNEFNAISLTGDAMGDAMLYGKGAGPLPTGSAVISDIMSIGFDLSADQSSLSKRHVETNLKPVQMIDASKTSSAFYMRVTVQDKPGVLEQVSHALSDRHINVSTIRQDPLDDSQSSLVIVTHVTPTPSIQQFKQSLNSMDDVISCDALYRVGFNSI